MASRWSLDVQPFADWTLAVAIAALAAAFALTDSSPLRIGGPTSIAGPVAVVAVSYALAGAALGLRRRAPFAVLAAVTVVLALPFLVFGSSEGFGSLAAVFIALYTVGSRAKASTAAAALVLYTAFWAVLALRDPLNPDLHSALWSWPVYLLGVMLLLVGAFLRTRRLYIAELRARAEEAEADREERIRAATADERARIARELHDAVAHAMSVMVMQAEAADELLDRDPARARIAIERVQRVGREGLGEMRRLLGVLRRDESPALAPQPGVSSLQALADEVSATGLAVRLTVEGRPAPLTAGVDISAYRIVQEALTNALKHAGASGVEVLLRYGESLELEISDDGDGPPPSGENGHGLIGMRERVALYQGSLDVGRSAAGGFRVHATLPIDGATLIRVLIVDDQELLRDGLSVILDAQDDIEVAAQAADGREAIVRARETMPDVVLMDVRMPVMDGIEATRQLRAAGFERLGILMLTTFDLDEYVYEALRAGANGFLLKDVPRATVVDGVRTVAAGDSLLAPAITRRLIERYASGPRESVAPPPQLDLLSPRERDTLARLARGRSNAEIAGELVLSEATVKTHVAAVLRKLDLRDRTQAVVWAYESGVVRPGDPDLP